MANNVALKIGGVAIDITSLSANDLAKVAAAIALANSNKVAIEDLKTAVAESNQLQHIIAAIDLGAADATPAGLVKNALYDCYYNAAGRYLTYDKATGAFKDEGVPEGETADVVAAQLKVFPALTDSTVGTPRVYEMTSSFDGFMKLEGAQTVNGLKTFTTAPQITAEQDISTIGDNDVVKGATAKGIDSRLTSAEGKVNALESSNNGKLSAKVVASRPADDDLEEGVLTIFPATDQLTDSGSGSGDDKTGTGE